jgi:hypothetical protein
MGAVPRRGVARAYTLESLGHHDLPSELAEADEEDVDDVLRRAVRFIAGRDDATIARVSSVIPGSCIACTDVVAYLGATPIVVARASLY